MRLILIIFCFVAVLWLTQAEKITESKNSQITKLEVEKLSEKDIDSESKTPVSQRKRDSGYSYNRPDRFTSGHKYHSHRPAFGQSGYRGRIVTRYPSQINRPFNRYGPPSQSAPLTKPSQQYNGHGQHFSSQQQHRNNHHQQQLLQHSNQFSNGPNQQSNGLWNQEVPSPIRHVDFVQPSPIASQNNEPFSSNTANYLPPKNQKLPIHTSLNTFAPHQQSQQEQQQQQQLQQQQQQQQQQQFFQNSQSQGQSFNIQSQNFIQGQGQGQEQTISDAALFLTQNAQAISQLYGAPETDQSFAPSPDEFAGQSNQVQNQNNQFEIFGNDRPSSEFQSPPLPSYASGTLSNQESLEQIQSLEKDRLIEQLQQALISQSESQGRQYSEQYARNHGGYIQNQNLLASFGSQFGQISEPSKFNEQNNQNSGSTINLPFGTGNTAFGQAPFLPGTTSPSSFTLGYGLTTTTQAPTTTTSTTTPTSTLAPNQPPSGTSSDGSSQVGTSLPAPGSPSFPQYGGFVPTLVGGTNFIANVPSYGTSFVGSSSIPAVVQTTGSSPTHFGLPIPSESAQKPVTPSPPISVSPALPPSHVQPGHPVSIPLQPLHPIAAPVHPISTPIHQIVPSVHPVSAPIHPITTPIHPVNTVAAAAHPTYGIQSSVYNPLTYKPVKAVYPVFYYPHLAYQLQKPSLPTYPWNYAPSFTHPKSTQIWK